MKEQKQFDDSKYRWDIHGIKWIKYIWIAVPLLFILLIVVLFLSKGN